MKYIKLLTGKVNKEVKELFLGLFSLLFENEKAGETHLVLMFASYPEDKAEFSVCKI